MSRHSHGHHKPDSGLLDNVSLGQDTDIAIGLTAAAYTAKELYEASKGKHDGGHHALKAGLGTAAALGAYELYQHDREKKRCDERHDLGRHKYRRRRYSSCWDDGDRRLEEGYGDRRDGDFEDDRALWQPPSSWDTEQQRGVVTRRHSYPSLPAAATRYERSRSRAPSPSPHRHHRSWLEDLGDMANKFFRGWEGRSRSRSRD